MAHIGYFRERLVVRGQWMDDAAFAEVVALCQFLPGPASSQVAFVLGLARAGPGGGVAAWLGFTLPSALLMLALSWLFGAGAARGGDGLLQPIIHGLKLAAVVIVCQAVIGMARALGPDIGRAAIAAGAALVAGMVAGTPGQLAAMLFGAAAGLLLCRDALLSDAGALPVGLSRRAATGCAILFAALLLLALLALGKPGSLLAIFDSFYRSGALVFGGGHVILPLLHDALVPSGMVAESRFLAGYGAAQALPGPLFAIAAYLGSDIAGLSGGLLALLAISLPGLLILCAVLPFWIGLRRNALARAGVAGASAAVVGLLALALYDPLWTGSVASWRDAIIVAAGLAALLRWRVPPLGIVGGVVAASLGVSVLA